MTPPAQVETIAGKNQAKLLLKQRQEKTMKKLFTNDFIVEKGFLSPDIQQNFLKESLKI